MGLVWMNGFLVVIQLIACYFSGRNARVRYGACMDEWLLSSDSINSVLFFRTECTGTIWGLLPLLCQCLPLVDDLLISFNFVS